MFTCQDQTVSGLSRSDVPQAPDTIAALYNNLQSEFPGFARVIAYVAGGLGIRSLSFCSRIKSPKRSGNTKYSDPTECDQNYCNAT